MVDKSTLVSILKGLGVVEENISNALPVLLGEDAPGQVGRLLDVDETRNYLGGVSRWTVMRAVERGELCCVRFGRRVMFDPTDLTAFVRSHRLKLRKNRSSLNGLQKI